MEEKNKPKRRIRKYVNDEDWQSVNLGKIATFSKGRGYSKSDLTENGHPVILYGRLYTNYQLHYDTVDTYAVPKENSVYSIGREVVVPSSGESAKDIAIASAITTANIILAGDLNIIYPNENVNPIFLALAISNGYTKEQLSKKAQGKSIVHLHNADLKEVDFYIPKLNEQNDIVLLFLKLNNLIELHQQKLQKLKAQKQAYLSEMFPQEGETKPKRRFAGFDGEWTKYTLGEILEYEQPSNYIVQSTNYDNNYKTPVLTAGNSLLLGYTNETFGIKEATEDNPVIIFDDFTTGSHYIDYPFKVKSSAMKLLGLKRDNFDFYFIFIVLQSIKYTPQGHERHWISKFSKFTVNIPEAREQHKIGAFFKKLDSLIEKQEERVKKYQALKQAYLNEMFV